MTAPQPPSDSPGGRAHGPPRVLLVVACLLLTFQSLASLARWRANRGELEQLLAARPEDEAAVLRQRLAFETSVHHAQLLAARTLVHDALVSGESASPSVEAVVAGLIEARALALEVLRQQPNSWQASMFLGAATYLEWSLRSDRRLYTAASRWEEPLLKARREARGKPEPRRFLAAAYLETWAALSEEKKAFAAEILRETFRQDPATFRLLAPVWLEVAKDREQALELIPDQTEAWQLLESDFARRRDWRAFCNARRRFRDALEAELEIDLEEARQRLRLGDRGGSRALSLSVVARAPRDRRFAPLAARALELYPPGLQGQRSKEPLEEWLRWALELHAVAVDPFNPRVLSRLTDAIGDLDPPTGALAALIADDIYRTERYEKTAVSKRGREWARYLIAKSQSLVDGGDSAAAARVLKDVHRSAHATAYYWLARLRVARATGDLVDLGTAEERLEGFRTREWRPVDWRWRGRRATLEVYPEISRSGRFTLSIEINEASERGAVVEVCWDGKALALTPIAEKEAIALTLEIEPKLHLLELRSLAGGEVYPGRVRIAPVTG